MEDSAKPQSGQAVHSPGQRRDVGLRRKRGHRGRRVRPPEGLCRSKRRGHDCGWAGRPARKGHLRRLQGRPAHGGHTRDRPVEGGSGARRLKGFRKGIHAEAQHTHRPLPHVRRHAARRGAGVPRDPQRPIRAEGRRAVRWQGGAHTANARRSQGRAARDARRDVRRSVGPRGD